MAVTIRVKTWAAPPPIYPIAVAAWHALVPFTGRAPYFGKGVLIA